MAIMVRSYGTRMPTVPHASTSGNRLVIFAPNWLGDAVMALPAIADVRRARPEDRIEVAARSAVAPLFTLIDGIDHVCDVAGEDLRTRSIDEALLLPNSFHAALIAWRAGIRERWGYRTQARSPLLTRAVAPPKRGHQAAYYQHLVRELGFPTGPLQPKVRVPADARRAGETLLSNAGWDGKAPLVAFAPGAANGRAKQWPAGSYAAVARALVEDGSTIVLIGAPADAPAGAEVIEASHRLGADVLNMIGRTDLPSLAGLLASCRALVCNDSGAMHFAAALGINVVAMFGPSIEAETRPLGDGRATVLTHDVWCRPCMLRECPIDHRCMRRIGAADVLRALDLPDSTGADAGAAIDHPAIVIARSDSR
jgi:heptosyltransferase-2